MFTGLIETTSNVVDFVMTPDGAIIEIDCELSNEIKIGDSVSINGVCLTVTENDNRVLSFEISKETLLITNFRTIKIGDKVNVERAMKANSRIDGHIVSGHIDGIAKVKSIKKDGFSYKYEFETQKDITKYIIKKGSVTVNGVSLTVTRVSDILFNIEIIPHTLSHTNLADLKTGDKVNIETDILSRYIEKFLTFNQNGGSISMKMLEENGYL